tara:strand:- start:94 stop:318 length:225 start_codon:yes stop_codon:yes gene_type:complete
MAHACSVFAAIITVSSTIGYCIAFLKHPQIARHLKSKQSSLSLPNTGHALLQAADWALVVPTPAIPASQPDDGG